MEKVGTTRTDRILDAAAALIARYGYDKTTVGELAQEAGISKGAVYLEFRGKDDVLGTLLVREARRLMEDTLRRVEGDPEGGRVYGIYRHALLALAANPLMRALYTKDSRVLGDYVRRQPASGYAERFLFGRTFVERMQEAGLLRKDFAPGLSAYLMGVVSYGLMSIEAVVPAEEAPPLEEVAEALADVVERGFGAPGGEGEAGKRALRALFEEIERQYEAAGRSTSGYPRHGEGAGRG